MTAHLFLVADVPRCPTCGFPGVDKAPRDCGDGHALGVSHRRYLMGDRGMIEACERDAAYRAKLKHSAVRRTPTAERQPGKGGNPG